MRYPKKLQQLIEAFKLLPGVGTKSAERFAFHILNWPEEKLHKMAEAIANARKRLSACRECGCLLENEQCLFCNAQERDQALLCVVATARDVFAIENTRQYRGVFHVLGGLLSPIEGRGPDLLRLKELKKRIEQKSISEIIIALDATLEGDATSLFLKQELEPLAVRVSRLAFGLPIGSSLDYIDSDTLSRAFSGRGPL